MLALFVKENCDSHSPSRWWNSLWTKWYYFDVSTT